MFVPEYPTDNLVPAPYNPRAISPDALENLQKSIQAIGFTKPIILDKRHVIAGHQRTKAARALGRTTVPAFVIPIDVRMVDEVMFNQLHNGTDLDVCDAEVRVPPGPEGFDDVKWTEIQAPLKVMGAPIRRMIADLVGMYGLWGCAVTTMSGEVISSQQYALTCRQMREPCRIYRVPDHLADEAAGWFKRQYGKHSYAHLPRETFVQSFAQPVRLRENKNHTAASGHSSMKDDGTARYGNSVCYTEFLQPRLDAVEKAGGDPRKLRILDFGCGQGDFLTRFRQRGYNVIGMEFFRRVGHKAILDTKAVHKMADELFASLLEHGPFDVVLCEAVINSIDTDKAEASVMACLNVFCKMGGTIIWGGRTRDKEGLGVGRLDSTRSGGAVARREIEFVDDDGYSGLYYVPFGSKKGRWFYQKYHWREQADLLQARYGFDQDIQVKWPGNMAFTNWQMSGVKHKEISRAAAESALAFEFDLMWPDGSVGRHLDAVRTYRQVYGHPADDLPLLHYDNRTAWPDAAIGDVVWHNRELDEAAAAKTEETPTTPAAAAEGAPA